MDISNPPTVSSSQLYQLASATVDANALATTNLTFLNGATAANSIPLCARVSRATGTLLLMVGALKLNGTTIQAVSAVDAAFLAAGADPLHYPVSSAVAAAIVPIAGNYAFTVATINGSASTVTVQIFGFKL